MELIKILEMYRGSILFKAVVVLKDPVLIREFYKEYVSYLGAYGKSHLCMANPARAARRNIGYALQFYGRNHSEWIEALPMLKDEFKDK